MPPTKRKLKENDPQNTVCRKQVKPSPVKDASCGRRASKRSKKQTLFMKPNGRAHYGPNGTAREASVNGGLDSQLAWAKAIAESLATYAANNAAELPQGGQAGAREEMVLVGGGSPPAAAATATATAAAAERVPLVSRHILGSEAHLAVLLDVGHLPAHGVITT